MANIPEQLASSYRSDDLVFNVSYTPSSPATLNLLQSAVILRHPISSI